ncbi:hypothetical protein JYP46_19235 [Nitratireductor aquimarinus]|uniref:hypothetical protein n=1 Tax=Alphaproteobacteria TaxID=28211 RepID=UPI0019D3E7FA|nr:MULTISPECIES: hypothetical protein [Alphaproteobacteria]MBN7758966.1 hypothetical protein [Nitratireductor aquimarinus]MBY6001639.1 hypothetical protein [Tritonibacter mobilis]MBY6023927.1 hypothetical protein [Nitratireductor sp. DP7N14-4]
MIEGTPSDFFAKNAQNAPAMRWGFSYVETWYDHSFSLVAVPALVTVFLFGRAIAIPPQNRGDYGFDIMPLLRFGAAVIGSLLAWLVWALIF